MGRDINRRKFLKLSGVAGAAAIAGCSGGGDGDTTTEPADTGTETTDPTTTTAPQTTESPTVEQLDPRATESALIEPATLKEWQDAGIVNTNDTAEDRVVVLTLDTSDYDGGHVPGAVKWSTDEAEGAAALTEKRLEGLAETPTLVPSGSVMDTVIQSAGIGQNTTVVLSGSAPYVVARAYWTMRYWGFPRERVKVLNGGKTAYSEEFNLEFEAPEHPTCSYTVKAFETPNYDLRFGLNEMIREVDAKNTGESDAAFLDLRGDTTPRPAGSTADPPASYLQADSFKADAPWQGAGTIEDHVWGLDGVEEGNKVITFCGSGYRAALSFFALDGVLGYDNVALYDGSVSKQWAHYDANNDPVPNDTWRVDINDRTEGDTGESSLEIDSDLNSELTELAQLDSNQVKKADIEYMGGDTSGGDFGCGS
ncbi:MAG: twin-arginine translocation signal domain-containing protein [Halapricum sp.]